MNKHPAPEAVVLVTSCDYEAQHEPVLRRILDEKAGLFCAVGTDCAKWEEAMDWLCVRLSKSREVPDAFIVTTSHPDESVEDVVEFAENWNLHVERSTEVRVIEI